MSYSIDNGLIQNNRCGRALYPCGLVVHATDDAGATAQNERDYFNNHPEAQASAHYVVDWNSIIRLIPENEVAWHAGPTANSKYLSFEICEPSGNNQSQFQEAWNRAVWLAADILKRHGWNVQNNMFSHNGVSQMYHETNHTDPYGYFKQYGRTWNEFCNAVNAQLGTGSTSSMPTVQPQQTYEPNAVIVGDDLFARKWDGSRELGHQTNIGDKIFVKDVSFSRQLALILYPVPGGYREAYVTNCSCIKYLHPNTWRNGHTPEPVYDVPGGHIIGSIDPWEIATILYVQDGWTAVVYNTGKGQNTKSGFVRFKGL